ncbi:DUF5134 domain-containing protein [Actinospica sp. MGRD01-02]|uniref:DUF5134 domain-containing protein n=1 Tax=Actinospica acidithermotolerans TaxID=2828514 RepID=A0A941EJM7_9ACTN|nr:DUF5134 domain-containing protein [Actinospica acidithermotolerans]MBR7830304.1 DUF5134 domain-containing protein [Actinospica acidithermotolerans]
MNAPAFLPAIISVLLIFVAGYAGWRLLAAPTLDLRTDFETDTLLLAAGVAGAGLISNWAHTLPRAAWSVIFTVAAGYFAVRAVIARAQVPRRNRLLAHACGSLVLVYMFLAGVAPSTLHGSTAGEYTMAPMPGMYVDTTITYPAIGLVCVAALAFYTASVLSRLSGAPVEGTERRAFAPRSVEACRVVVILALAYGILSKIV